MFYRLLTLFLNGFYSVPNSPTANRAVILKLRNVLYGVP